MFFMHCMVIVFESVLLGGLRSLREAGVGFAPVIVF